MVPKAKKLEDQIVSVPDRIQLATWINDRFKPGVVTAVEVGVLRGEYAELILKAIPNIHLTLVDAWDPTNNSPYFCQNPGELAAGEALVRRKFESNPNVVILKRFSEDAANGFADQSLDWVYIDANHCYKSVMADIKAWWSKVKVGGIISGHDFAPDKTNPEFKLFGIDKAVKGIFGTDFFLTGEETYKSWFHIKKSAELPVKEKR